MTGDDLSPPELYIRGRAALSEGNVHLAQDLIGMAVSGNPENAGWRLSFGHVLLDAGSSALALVQFAEALRIGPESAKLQMFRGKALAAEGNYLDAWRAYLRATELEPGSVAPWVSLGRFAGQQGDIKSAEIAYQSALLVDPEHVFAHSALAGIAVELDDVDGEVRHREAVADLKPAHVPSQLLAGACLIKANRIEEARHRYLRVVSLQPGHSGASAIAEELERWIISGIPRKGVASVDYYNSIYRKSESYSRDGADLHEAEHFAVICDLLQRDGAERVMDVGCGPGQFAQYLRSRLLIPYFGIDYSSVAIDQAVARGIPNTSFGLVDVVEEGLPRVPTGTSIVCTEVLEHILEDLDLLRLFPSGTHCYCSVPSFHTFGHLRHFASVREVEERYGEHFDDFEVTVIPIGSGVNKLYVFHGIRR